VPQLRIAVDQHKFKNALLDMGVEPEVVRNLCELPEPRLADVFRAVVQVRNLESLRVLEIVKEDITRFQENLRVGNDTRLDNI
jgi:hypothetical protein